jgi:hypothetical protein
MQPSAEDSRKRGSDVALTWLTSGNGQILSFAENGMLIIMFRQGKAKSTLSIASLFWAG